jgi:flagellar M-ring protein FliF
MNAAVAELHPAPLAHRNALFAGFSALDGGRKMGLALGVLALIGALATAFYLAGRPDYRVLFTNLSDKDGGAVVGQLAQMNVPYKFAEGGGAIMVPADKVHDLRLKLASAGLPKGSTVGFEMLDANRLGMTQFQERLTFQRGLEGELTRSISALSTVADARVHLALPSQNGFFREQQKPSASVLLTLQPGRSLDRAQVAGIVHLVASSVPEMNPKAVSVVDQSGTLLSQAPGDDKSGGVDSQQLEYVRTLERMYAQRITDLLEPIVGRENVRAQVTADVDFSQSEQTSEQHRPNQNGEPAAVRSSQLVESGGAVGKTAPGVPAGAVANQPPAPSSAPVNAPGGPGAAPSTAANASTNDMRRESMVNYEVDKTVKVTRNATGTVRRINAAVVLNHRSTKDKKGEPGSAPIPAEQLTQLKALVQEAIGFNQERGDSVNLVNAAFNRPSTESVEIAWWKQGETQDLLRTLAWPLGIAALGLVFFMGLVRPALKMMKSPPPRSAGAGAQFNAVLDEPTERPALATPVQNEVSAEALRLEDARRLAKENPVAVANIIKGWVNGEAPGGPGTPGSTPAIAG